MTRAKKVVILYSTGGMGHKKAAIAILEEMKERAGVEAEMIDVMEYGNTVYVFLYKDFYVFLMTRAKWLWGFLYYLSNMPLVDALTRWIRTRLDFASLPGLAETLAEKDPDAIVATHFLLPSIAGLLKKRTSVDSGTYVLITDYGPHAYWVSPDVDMFFVGGDSVAEELLKWNVSPERIEVTGIPTTREFLKDYDRHGLAREYGLDPSKKTVFMMSGGFGVGPIAEMLKALNRCEAAIQVIAVCGHNKDAYEKIGKLKDELAYPLILFGFTDKVAELMAVSDLMVTKAGGISVTESLNARLPMILYSSIPGQETWNEKFLTSGGAAEKAGSIDDIPVIADRMLTSDEVYSSFMAGIERLRKPDAARVITDTVTGRVTRNEGKENEG